MSNKSAAFLPIGIGVGLAVGVVFGKAIDNLALGLSLGVAAEDQPRADMASRTALAARSVSLSGA